MALREVFARLGFEWDGEKVQKADRAVKGLTTAAEGLVAVFAGNALLNGVKQFAAELDTLDDLSTQTGIATKQLQTLGFAAELSGSSAEEMNNSLTLLQKSLGRTSEATGPQVESLKKLGVELDKAGGGKLKDVLPQIFANFGSLKSEADEARVATDLFGRAGVRLIPTLRRGSEGLKEIEKDLESFGGVVGEDAIKKAGEFRDNIARMDRAFFALKGNFATAVFPQLSKIIVAFGKGVGKVSEWVKTTTLADTATKALAVTVGSKLFMALKPFLGAGLKFAAIFIAVDDLLAFLAGKDSLIGRLLDGAFGAGTADVVRAWVNDAIKEFSRLRDSASETFAKIENENASFASRMGAAFIAMTLHAAQTWPLVGSALKSELGEMNLAINQFILDTMNRWNAFVGKLKLPESVTKFLQLDTEKAEGRVIDDQQLLRGEAEKRIGIRAGHGVSKVDPMAPVRMGKTVSEAEAAAFSPLDMSGAGKRTTDASVSMPTPAGAVNTTTTNTIGPTSVVVQVPAGTSTRDANAIGSAAGREVGKSHRNAMVSLTQRAPSK